MAISALIIGALMVLLGLVLSLAKLRAAGEAAQGTNSYSTAMALIGLGCLLAMGSLLLVW